MKRYIFRLLSLLIVASACGSPSLNRTAASLSNSAPFDLVYEKGIWDKKRIIVCFGDRSHFKFTNLPDRLEDLKNLEISEEKVGKIGDTYRSMVRSIIEQEYSAIRTGIHFTGWKSCSADAKEADVVVLMSRAGNPEVPGGYASVGRNLEIGDKRNERLRPEKKSFVLLRDPKDPRFVEAMFPRRTSLKETFQLTALHEFGHLVGLGHEQYGLSKDHLDLNCELTLIGYSYYSTLERAPGLGPNVRSTGAYDPSSIMNYCWADALETITGTDFIVDDQLPAFTPGPERRMKTDKPYPIVLNDRPVKNKAGILPPKSILLADPSLFTAKKLSDKKTRYQVRVGLSQGDLHAIRCFYQYDANQHENLCRPRAR